MAVIIATMAWMPVIVIANSVVIATARAIMKAVTMRIDMHDR